MLGTLLSFALAGPARGDAPIVFLPGTGASILRTDDRGRYWLDDRALDPGYLGRGRVVPLNDEVEARLGLGCESGRDPAQPLRHHADRAAA